MKELLRAVGYLRPYWRTLLGAFLSLLVVSVTSLISPQILKAIIDKGIVGHDTTLLAWLAAALLGVAALRNITTFTQGFWSEKASQGAAYDMRNAIFSRIESLSFSYFDSAQTGQLMTRVTSDVDTVRTFTGQSLLNLVSALILLVGSTTILLITNWRLALIALLIVPAVFSIFIYFFRAVGPRFRRIQQKLGNLNTILQENFAGVRVVKAFAREPYEAERYGASNADLLTENMAVARRTAVTFPLLFLFAGLATAGVIWVGGNFVIDGDLTIGALIAFNSYLAYLLQPIFTLGGTLAGITQAAASAQRVFEIIDAPVTVAEKPDAIAMPTLRGGVRFKSVSFRYVGSDRDTLADITFETTPGQTVAVLGRTGSGKTSLVELIPRFYDVSGGAITLDGTDVRDVTLASLRAQIGIVMQEATLFSGTIRQNIAYGRPEATEAQIVAAAQAAQAHDFITAFDDGYDTIVGERGVTLSGGQRQRVALARTLLLDPALLILDDSTSAVDAETEYQIQQALKNVMVGRTAFVIAQRMSTVRAADLILVLDGGRLVAQGTHEELLRLSGIYAALIESQVRDDQPVAFAG